VTKQTAGKPEAIIASHVLTFGASQALRDYLVKQGRRVAFIACPLEDAATPRTTVTQYAEGRPVSEHSGHDHLRRRGPRLWLRDFAFVLHWGWKLGGPHATFVGVDNLNALAGLWLRACGRCGKVIYYVIDYTPRRFGSRLLNGFYQHLCRTVARRADAVWNLSVPMQKVHRAFGTPEARNLVVPIGLIREYIRVLPEDQVDPRQLIVVSTLYESKGVQLAVAALPDLPGVRLVVVGDGPYAPALRAQAQSLGVSDRVEFKGMMEQGPELFNLIARSRVALAPYVPDPASYTYYADPTKPKEYLACGVPVVITRVPWIAETIAQTPMGAAIDYDPRQLAAACRRLFEDQALWRQCRHAALSFTQELDWESIFKFAWTRVLEIPAVHKKSH